MQLAPSHLYQGAFDLKTAILMGVVVFAIIAAAFWYSVPGADEKRTSKRTFRRRAISIGLTKSQTRLLESFVEKVQEPASLLANTGELNRALAGALRNCSDSKNPTAKNEQLEIYGIKQRIDRISADRGNVTSSRQLRINQKIYFQQENGRRFASWITANLKEFYCAGIPENFEGKRWRKGSRIKLFVLGIDGGEIVFESKVLGYASVMGLPSVVFGHRVREKQSSIREHRRRAIGCRVILYPVRVAEKEQIRELTEEILAVNKPGLTGSLINLSPGGCSISSHRPLELGKAVRLVLEYRAGEKAVVFGEIVNTRVVDRSRSIIHVKFTKADVENMNLINSYVYDLC